MEEDRNTQRALDELADLFLTDSSVKADRPQPDAAEAAPDAAPDAASDAASDAATGAATETGSLAQELVGPEPVRLSPKLPNASRSPHASASATTSATTASHLRLHRDEPEAAGHAAGDADAADDADGGGVGVASPPDPLDVAVRSAIHRGQMQVQGQAPSASQPRAATVAEAGAETVDDRPDAPPTHLAAEAVLMGNLPGLSGPWLTQYAQLLAQHLGPVVMLHVDDQRIDAELIEPTDRPQSSGRVPPDRQSRDTRHSPRHSPREDLVARLESLVQPGPAQVQAIIVHTEASPRPEALSRLKALDHWTLLCGADDAAVVGGYRLIKSLVEADGSAVTKRMGVMIVGSDPDVGQAAAQKLGAATGSLLERPVAFVGAQRQMVPVNLRQLGRFGPTEQLWPRLAAWLSRLEPPQRSLDRPLMVTEQDTAVNPPDLEATAPPDPAPADFAAADWAWLREPESEPQPEPKPQGEYASPADPSAARAGATADANADAEPDLAQCLATGSDQIAGGVALEARCPNQPRTQLVLDQRGRLHLLRRHSSASDAADADTDALRSAIVDLLEARKWVLQHLELLQLTQRQCRFDQQAEPVLHLFTDRADLATGLIARLGDTLRLHLLKQVRIGAQSTWFCTPLQPSDGVVQQV